MYESTVTKFDLKDPFSSFPWQTRGGNKTEHLYSRTKMRTFKIAAPPPKKSDLITVTSLAVISYIHPWNTVAESHNWGTVAKTKVL